MSSDHGGNVYQVAHALGCAPEEILDYSASINPLGPPDGLAEQVRAWLARLRHYPDIHNRELTAALADFHQVNPGQVVVGNGSTELIYWLPVALKIQKAVIALPTFSEYERAFTLQDVQLEPLLARPRNRFQPTVAELEAALQAGDPQAVLVTHPGTPSGALLPRDVRAWLVEQCRERNLVCIVDEAFVDFCEEASCKEWLDECPGLVLIRSMTKFYGVPGLRLGYLLTSKVMAGRIRSYLPPWGVNALAQAAGVYCLGQPGYRERTLELVGAERSAMHDALAQLPGVHVFPSEANYLLVELAGHLPPVRVLRDDLVASERILIRDCSSFTGLGDRRFRLSVRLPEENGRLIRAVAAWVERHGTG